jgi:hypothetical protein
MMPTSIMVGTIIVSKQTRDTDVYDGSDIVSMVDIMAIGDEVSKMVIDINVSIEKYRSGLNNWK